MKESLARLIAAESGVIARRDHPALASQLDWLCRTGELVRVLPGVYAVPEVATRFAARVTAARRWRPDAVVSGRAAARMTFWPTLPAPVVDLSGVRNAGHYTGFRCSAGDVPEELVIPCHGVRTTCPALTALELCAELGGEPIDVVLRTRRATLTELRRAMDLSPGRVGNRRRRRLLLDSRDEPWSEAERLAHAMLRAASITGWRSNYPVRLGGRAYFLDIAFPGVRLAVEIDGREHHSSAEVFESDRERQNALVAAGWRVLRFTWRMLTDEPERVVALIRQELRRAAKG